VTDRTRQLFEEKQKVEDLLHRMLPPSVARKLTHGIAVEPETFTGASHIYIFCCSIFVCITQIIDLIIA
jgi:hypothetical protein